MLYNLGITYEAIHRGDRAVCALERFITEVPDADPGLRRDAEERLGQLRPTIGRIQVDAPAGAVLSVDGEERGTAPATAPLCAAEGKHRLIAAVAGAAPVGLDVNVRPGATLRVALDPSTSNARLLSDSVASAAAVAAGSVTPGTAEASTGGVAADGGDGRPVWKRGWFWGVVGVVVAGAVVGVVLGTRPNDAVPRRRTSVR